MSGETPSFSVARQASPPAEIPVTRDKPAILAGTGLSAVPPLPSWPRWPWPQANTMPSERSARAKSFPAAILVTWFSTATLAGAAS